MSFNRDDFDSFLLENDCVGFYDPPGIRLKSKRFGKDVWSTFYINIRDALKTISLKRKLANFVYDFCIDHNIKPNCFIGVPEGATQIGEAVNELIDYKNPEDIPSIILRSKPKGHGEPEDRYSVGRFYDGLHVGLIEDVTTTGSSVMNSVLRVQEKGVIIDKVIAIANRLEKRDRGTTVKSVLEKNFNVGYISMTDASTLLPKAYKQIQPGEKIAKEIEEYYKKYGAVQIKLRGIN